MSEKPVLHPFEVASEDVHLRGMCTVAEVVPTVFVFSVYDTSGTYISQHVTTTIKDDSPSLPPLRAKCIPATALDRAAYDRYVAHLVTRKR